MTAIDEIAEIALIEISRIQREQMSMSKRLATDAKIILENADYIVHRSNIMERHPISGVWSRAQFRVGLHAADMPHKLLIIGGTVDNAEIEALLEAKKC